MFKATNSNMLEKGASPIETIEVTTLEMFSLLHMRNHVVWNKDENQYCYFNGINWVTLNNELVALTLFSEGFESGNFTANSWVTKNGGENNWVVGGAEKTSGLYGAYISSNGGLSANYTSIGAALDVSHVYKDIVIPATATELFIELDWKCEGELGFDYGRIFAMQTSVTPVANIEVDPFNPNVYQIGNNEYNDNSIFAVKEKIQLPILFAGGTVRLCFSFRNDSSIENPPAFCIDNLKVKIVE